MWNIALGSITVNCSTVSLNMVHGDMTHVSSKHKKYLYASASCKQPRGESFLSYHTAGVSSFYDGGVMA